MAVGRPTPRLGYRIVTRLLAWTPRPAHTVAASLAAARAILRRTATDRTLDIAGWSDGELAALAGRPRRTAEEVRWNFLLTMHGGDRR